MPDPSARDSLRQDDSTTPLLLKLLLSDDKETQKEAARLFVNFILDSAQCYLVMFSLTVSFFLTFCFACFFFFVFFPFVFVSLLHLSLSHRAGGSVLFAFSLFVVDTYPDCHSLFPADSQNQDAVRCSRPGVSVVVEVPDNFWL